MLGVYAIIPTTSFIELSITLGFFAQIRILIEIAFIELVQSAELNNIKNGIVN